MLLLCALRCIGTFYRGDGASERTFKTSAFTACRRRSRTHVRSHHHDLPYAQRLCSNRRQDSYRGLRRIPRDLGDGSKSFSDSVYSNVYLIVKVGRLETRSNPESLSKPTFKYDSYGEDQSESRGEPESLPARVGGTWKEIRHEET
ncbi:hypothetical protein AX14_008414 [Amanita brunnescens Koide BX004]|nr:hypothetical protein AX14_008414 [Amanita brunnescens Koide BX004]